MEDPCCGMLQSPINPPNHPSSSSSSPCVHCPLGYRVLWLFAPLVFECAPRKILLPPFFMLHLRSSAAGRSLCAHSNPDHSHSQSIHTTPVNGTPACLLDLVFALSVFAMHVSVPLVIDVTPTNAWLSRLLSDQPGLMSQVFGIC